MNSHVPPPSVDSNLREVVDGIFENMLHLPLQSGSNCADLANEALTAVVEFKGGWSGLIALGCGVGQARLFAAHFLALPGDQLADQIVADVLGEIVNMIAGNLKSVFAHDIRLALATVTRGSAQFNLPFPPLVQQKIWFRSAEGHFYVAVLAFPCEPRTAWATRP